MVQAGKGTDAVIDQLVERFEPGDIIVDGGNANFHRHHPPREGASRATGIHFVGAGISGGEEGALNGPSIMPGGSDGGVRDARPDPRVDRRGRRGRAVRHPRRHRRRRPLREDDPQRHRVRRHAAHRRGLRPAAHASAATSPAQIADVFAEWNKGDLESYLIEITAEVLRQVDAETGKPFVDVVLDQAGSKGTGVWTVQNALDLGVPVVGHRRGGLRARRLLASPRSARRCRPPCRAAPDVQEADADAFADDVRQALYASKVVAYAQGFDAIIAGAEKYGWDIDKGDDREDLARRLHHPRPVPQPHRRRLRREPRHRRRCSTAPYFADAVADGEAAWRRVVATAALVRRPGPRLRRRARLLRLARAPSACPPRSSRASATSSAPTPTSASTRTAPSTPSGRGDRTEIESEGSSH